MTAVIDRRPPRCQDHTARRKAGCKPCRAHDAWGKRNRARHRAAGELVGLCPVDDAAEHLRQLTDVHGWTLGQLAALTGYHSEILGDIRAGRRSRGILAETRAAILAVPAAPPPPVRPRIVSSVGTRRRIRALMRIGWTYNHIAERYGCRRDTIDDLTSRNQVTATTHDRIAAVYRQLAVAPGPSAITRARAATPKPGHSRGWPGPMCWTPETIDDPAAVPDWGDAPAGFDRAACKAAACPLLELRRDRRRQYDAAAVEQALLGIRTARQLSTAERRDVVARLFRRGDPDDVIAARLRWSTGEAVTAFRNLHGITTAAYRRAA
jgi:hypothetical protein